MRKYSIAIVIATVLLILLLLFYFAIAYMPLSRIDEVCISGIATYSEKKILSSCLYESVLLSNIGSLEKRIEDLAYVEKAEISFHRKRILLKADINERGLLIKSGDDVCFYDGASLSHIDFKDLESLKRTYIVLDVDKDYLVYLKKYGFLPEFSLVIDSMLDLDGRETLITKAEFSNNETIESGVLNLEFESLSSKLIVDDLTKLSYLDDCIDMICSDIEDRRSETIFSDSLYRLESGGLYRLKR